MAGGGVEISDDEAADRWQPWTPSMVRDHLKSVDVPWGVAGGWAIDLFLGEVTRPHGDIEISVPAARFCAIASALDEFDWDVVGDGRRWSYPDALGEHRQTWLKDRATGRYHLDVIREPHDGDVWIYRRDPTIRVPLGDVYERTADGTPFVVPEIVLLFKASHPRPRDETDLERVIDSLTIRRRVRLAAWLRHLHPRHPWIQRIDSS